MTPEEIKSRLDEKGLSQGRLARRFRIAKTTAHLLVNRKMTSARLDRRLAKELGVTVAELRGEKAVGE